MVEYSPPELTLHQVDQLDRLAVRIASSPHNLVARGDRAAVRDLHVAEAIALEPLLGARDGDSWIDVGTGGGLPGLVLAVLRPGVRWTLLDATRKKTDAVRAFADELAISVDVVTGRAETLAHDGQFREQFDGAVSRAVAPLATLVELCRGFVRSGGVVAAVKGPRWSEEVVAAQGALKMVGLEVVHTNGFASPDRPSWLVTMRAMGPAPPPYPRREGRPSSHPLGGTRR